MLSILHRLTSIFHPPKMPHSPLIAVVGATGTGKSQLAVDIASRFDGEVINADAMQLYHGLPIITNKITCAEQRGVPHHLLGCIPLAAPPWRVDAFVREARSCIAAVHARGKVPVLVGGTHYYLQSLLFKQKLAAGADKAVSEAEYPELERPTAELYARLKEVDPVMAERWHPSDHRKIRRSLEIWLHTGRRASDVYREQAAERERGDGGLVYSTLVLWTDSRRDVLRERLDGRVDKMVQEGLVDEVRELRRVLRELEAGGESVDLTRGIWVSIGFKEFLDYADDAAGDAAMLAASIEATKVATRQYAKDQVRWIRIKLLLALREAQALDKLFLIDTTDASGEAWAASVLKTACETTEAFLAGTEMAAPASLSELAAEMLTPKQEYDVGQRPDLWQTQTCEVCHVTAVTEREWQQHLQGQRHKKLVKKAEKKLFDKKRREAARRDAPSPGRDASSPGRDASSPGRDASSPGRDASSPGSVD